MLPHSPRPASPPEERFLLSVARALAASCGCPHTAHAAAPLPVPRLTAQGALRAAEGAAHFRRLAWARQHCAPWIEAAHEHTDAHDEPGEANP